MIDQTMPKVPQNISAFDQQMIEMNVVEESLKEVQTIKEGCDILVPLSSGIFVKAKIASTDEFLVNVGSSVSVKKKGEDVIALIHNQQVEIRKVLTEATQHLEQLAVQAQQVQLEVNALLK